MASVVENNFKMSSIVENNFKMSSIVENNFKMASNVENNFKMASKKKKPVEVVVFENPEKKKLGKEYLGKKKPLKRKGEPESEDEEPTASKPKLVYDRRKAGHDIRKLGIHGFDKKQKDEAMVDLLVELGAKRPTGRRYHIQEYQKIKKQKDKEEKEREDLERQAGIKPKKKEATKKKRDKDDIFNFVDGQIGFHKDGVQFVKKKFKR